MRVVFAGTPQVALPTLQALVDSSHEVVGVITRPDAPQGRSKKLIPSPVAQKATELGIEVFKPTKVSDADFVAKLTQLAPDVCPVVAYGALLPQSVINIAKHGWINLHFSLLPAWRGAAPVQRSLMAGDIETGASVFRIVKDLDAGPIYRQLKYQIEPEDTAGDLLEKLAKSGAELMLNALDDISNGVQPRAQSEDQISIASKIDVAECVIDWSQPAEKICNLIRGASPNPGARASYSGNTFKIYRAQLAENSPSQLSPGQIVATKREVFVGTGSFALKLVEVQPSGKKIMPATDWARGAKPTNFDPPTTNS